MIVGDQWPFTVCVWANYSKGVQRFRQRKYPVVFQQNQRLFRCTNRLCAVFPAGDLIIGNLIIFAVVRQKAQPQPCPKRMDRAPGDILLSHKPGLIGLHDLMIQTAAVDIAAGFQRKRHRLQRIFRHLVVFMKILNRPAVRSIISAESPFPPQDLLDQRFAAATWLAVHTVIRTHDALDAPLLHAFLKRVKVCFPQIFWRHNGVEFMPELLRSAVNRKMLCACRRLQVFSVALNAPDKTHAKTPGQIRIFPIGFLSTTPATITENIDIRRPQCEALINIIVAFSPAGIELCACFGGDDISDLLHLISVKHCRHCDCLWKHRRRSCTRDAVESLIPPVIGRDPQPLHGWRIKAKHQRTLFQRHFGGQLFRPFLKRHASSCFHNLNFP